MFLTCDSYCQILGSYNPIPFDSSPCFCCCCEQAEAHTTFAAPLPLSPPTQPITGYTPLNTQELLEAYAKQSVDSWMMAEGSEAVAEAEDAILENLSRQARAVVATIGGEYGAARRPNKWRHLFAGFTVWLSQSEALDEKSATEEAKRHIQEGRQGYANAEVVVKLGGWDANYSKFVTQASLSALKRLIL